MQFGCYNNRELQTIFELLQRIMMLNSVKYANFNKMHDLFVFLFIFLLTNI